MISENSTYWLIDNQSKIKSLTKLFTYLISKGIESLKFEYINDIFVINSTNYLSNKVMELSINKNFFKKINIEDSSILIVPILNIIKDLKSYKGKKVFPNVYFIFDKNIFCIHSIYENSIELSSITSRSPEYNTSSMFKLESIIQFKVPDISFNISIEKLNILLNNTYVKEHSIISISSGMASIVFDDAHGNKKIVKCELDNSIYKSEDGEYGYNRYNSMSFTIENFILKDLMKFFKDNLVLIGIFINEEKIRYSVDFDDDNIKFKLVSHMSINSDNTNQKEIALSVPEWKK